MADTVVLNDKFKTDMQSWAQFQTTIVPLSGGYEDRNQDWEVARFHYQVEFANRPIAEIREILAHILGRRGAANAFPVRDPFFGDLADENIGTGDGTTASFQIVKTYADDDRPYQRIVTIIEDLVVKVAGVTKTLTTHYTVTDGLITFTSGNIPTAGQAVTVSGSPLVRVRYSSDENRLTLHVNPDADGAYASAGPFVLVEVTR